MKIKTKAKIAALFINEEPVDLSGTQIIDLEFSAIDTGGSFRDAILDFSFVIPQETVKDISGNGTGYETRTTIQHPSLPDRKATFSCQVKPTHYTENKLVVNGRLHEDQLSKELIGFMLHLLR